MEPISPGDWVRYRHHEGWMADGKVLEVRPDNKLVVGEHDNDPEPDVIEKGDVIRGM